MNVSIKSQETKNEMSLLITIFFSLLLSVAFVSQFEVEPFQGSGLYIPWIFNILFIEGIIGILIAYITYNSENLLLRDLSRLILGVFAFTLIAFFIDAFIHSVDIDSNFIKNVLKSEKIFLILLGTIITLVIIIFTKLEIKRRK